MAGTNHECSSQFLYSSPNPYQEEARRLRFGRSISSTTPRGREYDVALRRYALRFLAATCALHRMMASLIPGDEGR